MKIESAKNSGHYLSRVPWNFSACFHFRPKGDVVAFKNSKIAVLAGIAERRRVDEDALAQ
jgi:hypothetical protein